MSNTLLSYRLALKQLGDMLRRDYQEPYLISVSILSHVLNLSQSEIFGNLNKYLSISQNNTFKNILRRLNTNYPVSYILSNKNFYGLDFTVNQGTLIPRPETELLVTLVLEHLNINQKKTPLKLLDIGTGTGCIPISILANTNQLLDIYAIDISPAALSLAKRNVRSLLPIDKSTQLKFGIYNILGDKLIGHFDIIVSNPPYISKDEYEHLETSLFFEPKIALTDNFDGLTFYRKFVDIMNLNLSPKGVCFFEIHSSTASKVRKIFNEGLLRKNVVNIHKDIFDRDRVIEVKFT